MKRSKKQLAIAVAFVLSVITLNAQLSLQSYNTNLGGGSTSGGNFTGEVAIGGAAGITESTTLGSYVGFIAGNLETAAITVRAENGSGGLIGDNVSGYLLKVTPSGSYDTLETRSNVSSEFSFSSVFTGRYLVNISGDPSSYIATYNGNVIAWDEADQIILKNDSTVAIDIEAIPAELPPIENGGTISGTIETELVDTNGRVLQTQPDAGRGCGLRTNQDGTLNLVAFTETDASGFFEFTNLPAATYEFFIDVPGIPFDQAAATTINLEEGQENSDEFQIQAVITEEGIQVQIQEVLGLIDEDIIDLQVYPNPVSQVLNVNYRELKADGLAIEMRDLKGKLVFSNLLNREVNEMTISVADFQRGIYFLRLFNPSSKDGITYKIILN